MKKSALFTGFFLIAALLFVGCSDGSGGGGTGGGGGIDAKWQGRYNGGSDYVIINSTTATYSIDGYSGSMSKITTGTGGNVMNSGTVVGSWVYVLSNGNTVGFVMNITKVNPGTFVGVGFTGARSLMNEVTKMGGSFSPSPSTSGLPTDFYFWGTKQ
jgi:hypothetical protein